MALAENPVYHSRSKHFDVDIHSIREKVYDKIIELKWVETEKMIADRLTKPLGSRQFYAFRRALGLTLPLYVASPSWMQDMNKN
jgi:hypothetical protein